MKFKVFFVRYVQSMPDLFGNVVPVDGTDALKPVIINDFLKRKELSFINPRNGKTYHRHYAIMPQGGVAVIDVGEYVDERERPKKLIFLEMLPLNDRGKVNKEALRELL